MTSSFCRTTSARDDNTSLKNRIALAHESLDENRSTLAEKQQEFAAISELSTALETEVSTIRDSLDSVTKHEMQQREYINSLLSLCKGGPTQPDSLTENQYSRHLSEKITLLSTLEKENEYTLATARDKENEKSKLIVSIREGLQIGQKYKALLVTLSRESKALEGERIAGKKCLNECRENLEFALQRVAEKVVLP
jgi:hypothetical protein